MWSFENVTVCPKHYQSLVNKCPHCDRSIPWLTGKSQVGYCPKCDRWLGSFSSNQYSTSESDLARSIWIAQNLGELISSIPSSLFSIHTENISKAFNMIIDATCEGNITAFAKIFALPKNTVWMWCKDKSIPELRMILTVCYCLDISLRKYRSYQKQQTAERIQKCCQEVEQAVRILHQGGEYPSEARVSQLISQPGYFRYEEVRRFLNQAILDLRI